MQNKLEYQDNKSLYFHRESCPSCFSSIEKSTLEIRSSPPAELMTPEDHGKFLSGYDNQRFFFSYNRCLNCGLLYCPIYYDEEQLNRLYGNQPENMGEVPLECRIKTQEMYFKKLKKYSSLSGGYLEIGADVGLFTRLCVQEGNFDNFYLFEPNLETHNDLKKVVEKKSYKIVSEDFDSNYVISNDVSTAVIIHTLDHVLEPRKLLRETYKSLEDNGVILIVTHDESSLLARVLKERWPPYTLQHPHLFSSRTMTGILQEEGFRILEITKSSNYFPLSYLIKSFFTVFGFSKVSLPEFLSFRVPIKLGNILTVAQKIKK